MRWVLMVLLMGCGRSPVRQIDPAMQTVVAGCYSLEISPANLTAPATGSFCVQYSTDLTFWGPLKMQFPDSSSGTASGMMTGFVVEGLLHLTLWPGGGAETTSRPVMMVDGSVLEDGTMTGVVAGGAFSAAGFAAHVLP